MLLSNQLPLANTWPMKHIDKEGKFKVSEAPGKGRHDPCVVPRAVPIVEGN